MTAIATAITERTPARTQTQGTKRRRSQPITTQPTTMAPMSSMACTLLVAVHASEVFVMKKKPKTTARNTPGSASAMRSGHVRARRARGGDRSGADVRRSRTFILAMVRTACSTSNAGSPSRIVSEDRADPVDVLTIRDVHSLQPSLSRATLVTG